MKDGKQVLRDKLNHIATYKRVLHMITRDTFDTHAYSDIGQQCKTVSRRYIRPFNSHNTNDLSCIPFSWAAMIKCDKWAHFETHTTTSFGTFRHMVYDMIKGKNQSLLFQPMMLHTTCMNLDVAKQGTNLQPSLYNYDTNKYSSVWEIGLKMDMVRETEFVNSKSVHY